MPDKEKVIKALQTCSVQNDVGCQCCPYFEERKTYGHEWCTTLMAQDTLALLKEQETHKFFVDESGKITPLPVVVRCKYCKHGEPGACGDGIDCDGVWHDDDWFCADGEKDGT